MGRACFRGIFFFFFRGIVLDINNHSRPFSNDGAGEERLSASVIACVGLTAQAVWE